MTDSSCQQRAAEMNRWWIDRWEDEWRERSCTVPLYLPNAALLKQKQAQWGQEQKGSWKTWVSLGSLTSIVIKAAEELWQDKLSRQEPRWRSSNMKTGRLGWWGMRVTLSVTRRAMRRVKCALPEVLQPRQTPERKLLLHLALIRSKSL